MFEIIENSEKSYQKVIKQIQNLILKGQLKKGEKLPPERQLSEMLGVGRPTLKQALSALESMGIIEGHHGGGNYICNDITNIFNPFTLKFFLSEGKNEDILEFRYILEVQFAKLAALKASKNDIANLEFLLSKMQTVITTEERLNLNYDFHLEIAKIAGNSLIVSVYESIMELIIMQTTVTDGYNYHISHKNIVDAIQSGNPQLAAKVMSDHFSAKFPNYKYYDSLYQI